MSKKDLPKSQLEPTPLWQPSVDAQLRLDDEELVESPSATTNADWLSSVLAEHGVSPPVDLVADHFNELDEAGQSTLFGELNDACGYDFSVEVVTLAKKKRDEELASAGASDGGAS